MNYELIYTNIIERAKSRTCDEYTETHHILPRSLGGTDTCDNLVKLTAREHFICHWLLYNLHKNHIVYGPKTAKAWAMMRVANAQHSRYTSRSFDYARKARSAAMQGANNPTRDPVVREKMRKAQLGKTVKDSTKKKISIAKTAENSTFFKGYPVIDNVTYDSLQAVVDCGLAKNKSQVDYRIRRSNYPTWTRSDLI